MQHIVINNQQRQQYILIFIVTIVISFGLGFWFGYHTNSTDELTTTLSQLETELQEDGAPTPDWSGESAPQIKTESDKKDAAKPVAVSKPAAIPTPAKPVVKPVITAPPVVTPKPAVPVVTPKPAAPAPVPAVVKPAPVVPVTAPVPTPAAPPEPAANQAAPASATPAQSITNSSLSAEAANTVFTVQAGVFESRDNAMKLVTELNNKGFDAYVDEVVASSGDTKFNVRFGNNTDRDQVQRKLTRFKQLYTTSAYIIVLDQ